MSKQHYGALAGVVVGYVLCRVLSFPFVDAIGAIARHERSSGTAIGVVVAAIPFAVLSVFTVLNLRAPLALHLRPVKALFVAGWFVAGGIMGMLPWSRMGLEINLRMKEAHTAPGFLHGIDMTILVGVFVTVGLLFIALRSRHESAHAPIDWIEHQFEDGR